jgi:hypothetical protein
LMVIECPILLCRTSAEYPAFRGRVMNESDHIGPLLEAQRAAFRAEGVVEPRVRQDRLERAIDLLVTHQRVICEAHSDDFGQRSETLTRFVDILPALSSLKYARRRVARWMRRGRARRQRGNRASTVGRDRSDQSLELPGHVDVRAACGNPGSGEPVSDQALRVHACGERAAQAIDRGVFRPVRSVGGDRRAGGRRGILPAALRSSRVHRIDADRAAGDGLPPQPISCP